MPRLIDADALLKDITKRYCENCDRRKGIKNGVIKTLYEIGEAPCRACAIDDMKGELDDAPTVDAPTVDVSTTEVEPVKHGQWEAEITRLGTMVFKCSECQKYSDIHWAYCPYCGARMDGERREDAKRMDNQ